MITACTESLHCQTVIKHLLPLFPNAISEPDNLNFIPALIGWYKMTQCFYKVLLLSSASIQEGLQLKKLSKTLVQILAYLTNIFSCWCNHEPMWHNCSPNASWVKCSFYCLLHLYAKWHKLETPPQFIIILHFCLHLLSLWICHHSSHLCLHLAFALTSQLKTD